MSRAVRRRMLYSEPIAGISNFCGTESVTIMVLSYLIMFLKMLQSTFVFESGSSVIQVMHCSHCGNHHDIDEMHEIWFHFNPLPLSSCLGRVYQSMVAKSMEAISPLRTPHSLKCNPLIAINHCYPVAS